MYDPILTKKIYSEIRKEIIKKQPDFPVQCCGITTAYLIRILSNIIPDQYYYAIGTSDKYGAHCWIENHKYIFDFTCQQFIPEMNRLIYYKDEWRLKDYFTSYGIFNYETEPIDQITEKIINRIGGDLDYGFFR